MSRDTRDDRPPLRVSELPPNQVVLRPGEPRALMCPGCGCWQVPRHGRVRRHDLPPEKSGRGAWLDPGQVCPGSGRGVWFDLTSGEWAVRLEEARRSARRPVSLQRATERAFRQARARERSAADRAA